MKNVLLLDTSVGSLNQGDEIINISIKKNWSELFENNYIMNMASHTPMYTLLQSIIYQKNLACLKMLITSFYVEQMHCILIC